MRFQTILLSILGVSPVVTAESCNALIDRSVTDLSDCCSGTLPRNETVNFSLIEISCGHRLDTTGRISRTWTESPQQCVGLILRADRGLVAAWDPTSKYCWYTDNPNPPLIDSPGSLLMRFKEELEQEDCSVKVREAEAKCDQDKEALKTDCDKDKEALKTDCDKDKEALKTDCDKDKEALKTDCDKDKEALKTDCDKDKEALKTDCDKDKEALKTDCDKDKEALKTDCDKQLEAQKQTYQNQLDQCLREGGNHIGNGAWPNNQAMTNKRIRATALAYSPTRPNLVATVDLSRNIDIHDVTTGQTTRLATMPSDDGYATSIAWHPDGQSILVACFYAVVKIYTVGPSGTSPSIYTLIGEKKDLRVPKVAFSPDGKTAVAGVEDGRVLMWDVATHRLISGQDKHSAAVNGLAFSSKDGTLVTGSADKTIKFWTGTQFVKEQPMGVAVRSVAFSPNGVHLACGLEDSSIKILDAQTRNQRRDLRAHAAAVVDVAFSADGNALLSASEDRTVRVWSLIGDYAQTQDTDRKAQAIAMSPNGNSLAVLFDMRPAVFYAKP